VQLAAVGQWGLGTEKIGSGSENAITVLIRAGSFSWWPGPRRFAPLPAIVGLLSRWDKLDGIFVKSAEVVRWARQP
jgi:hypothetical protein